MQYLPDKIKLVIKILGELTEQYSYDINRAYLPLMEYRRDRF
jgi:hypothetical protein